MCSHRPTCAIDQHVPFAYAPPRSAYGSCIDHVRHEFKVRFRLSPGPTPLGSCCGALAFFQNRCLQCISFADVYFIIFYTSCVASVTTFLRLTSATRVSTNSSVGLEPTRNRVTWKRVRNCRYNHQSEQYNVRTDCSPM